LEVSAVEKRRVVFGNHEDQLDGEVVTFTEFVSRLRPKMGKWRDRDEMYRTMWEHWPLVPLQVAE
jgi:hypothetical protein